MNWMTLSIILSIATNFIFGIAFCGTQQIVQNQNWCTDQFTNAQQWNGQFDNNKQRMRRKYMQQHHFCLVQCLVCVSAFFLLANIPKTKNYASMNWNIYDERLNQKFFRTLNQNHPEKFCWVSFVTILSPHIGFIVIIIIVKHIHFTHTHIDCN